MRRDQRQRQAEVVAREHSVSKHTIYAWKANYGGLEVTRRNGCGNWKMKTRD
jgi:hypothetical protein